MKKIAIILVLLAIIIVGAGFAINAANGAGDPIAQRIYAEAALESARADANIKNAMAFNSQVAVMATIAFAFLFGSVIIFAAISLLDVAKQRRNERPVNVMYLPQQNAQSLLHTPFEIVETEPVNNVELVDQSVH